VEIRSIVPGIAASASRARVVAGIERKPNRNRNARGKRLLLSLRGLPVFPESSFASYKIKGPDAMPLDWFSVIFARGWPGLRDEAPATPAKRYATTSWLFVVRASARGGLVPDTD
jgi:hypothetical protein